MTLLSLPLSILDLAPVPSGVPAATAVCNTVEMAQLAERLGYQRVWYAEHHSMPSVASSAPEILIARAASATQRIRLGSGGIMLPNHAPLKVAENFHTLEALFPGRIDLGLGRAPGGVPGASRALRAQRGELFAQMLAELEACSRGTIGNGFEAIHAQPSGVNLPPIWLLGSSGATARMAGEGGYGYGFASHFSPAPAAPVLRVYRENFRASAAFPRPHAVLVVAAVCAETESQAHALASTMELAWLRIQRGEFLPLPSPEEAQAYPYGDWERDAIKEVRARTLVGTPTQLRQRIEALHQETRADEVMLVSNIHNHDARLLSCELIARAFKA